jgi:hypothetical protein
MTTIYFLIISCTICLWATFGVFASERAANIAELRKTHASAEIPPKTPA